MKFKKTLPFLIVFIAASFWLYGNTNVVLSEVEQERYKVNDVYVEYLIYKDLDQGYFYSYILQTDDIDEERVDTVNAKLEETLINVIRNYLYQPYRNHMYRNYRIVKKTVQHNVVLSDGNSYVLLTLNINFHEERL